MYMHYDNDSREVEMEAFLRSEGTFVESVVYEDEQSAARSVRYWVLAGFRVCLPRCFSVRKAC